MWLVFEKKFLFLVKTYFAGPGIYREDQFGVRLENVLEVVTKPHIKHYYSHSYLGFKDVTLVPYCRKLMKLELLSVEHVGIAKNWFGYM